MRCQEFRAMTDSYLSDELLVETNHEVLHHLENCVACRQELAAHRSLRTQMRAAVKSAPEMQINPVFAKRLQTDLHQTALRPTVWTKLKSGAFLSSPILTTSVAACLLLGVLFAGNFLRHSFSPVPENIVARQNQTNQPAENSRSNESNAAQFIQVAWREITHEAVGDHENCALHFRLAEDPITLKKASEKYGKFNKDLDKAVIESLGEVFKQNASAKPDAKIYIFESHSCVYQGRRFAHVILMYRNRRISVLVAEENLPGDDNENIFSEATAGVFVARFRTARHAVFVISDLTAAENVTIAEAVAPAVRRHIERSEAGI